MPELPEVETIRRSLEKTITGQTIEDVQLFWPGAVKGWEKESFPSFVRGRVVDRIERRGKYLLIHLDQGRTIVAHMRMTGRLLYYGRDDDGRDRGQAFLPERHTHVVFKLSAGELHFNDQRKFGRLEAMPTAGLLCCPALAKLGPEPLDRQFDGAMLYRKLQDKKVCLKAALLDQTLVAGLGNIYADEVMFAAGIQPERLTCYLTEEEAERLCLAIKKVLSSAIAARGTTFRDYLDARGAKGSFQDRLKVYGRAGEPCLKCGSPLVKARLAGRTTVWCPRCQA